MVGGVRGVKAHVCDDPGMGVFEVILGLPKLKPSVRMLKMRNFLRFVVVL